MIGEGVVLAAGAGFMAGFVTATALWCFISWWNRDAI